MNENQGDVGSKAVVEKSLTGKIGWRVGGGRAGGKKRRKGGKAKEERGRAMKSKSGELATRKML